MAKKKVSKKGNKLVLSVAMMQSPLMKSSLKKADEMYDKKEKKGKMCKNCKKNMKHCEC